MTTTPTEQPRLPTAPPEFDPLSEAALRDPSSMFLRAREETPVFWSEAVHAWIITRREDVLRYLNEPDAFATATRGFIKVPEKFADRFSAELPDQMMPAMDPPEHTGPKKAVQKGFLRPRILKLEDRITHKAHELIDAFPASGRTDLMAAYSNPLTMHTLLGLLGLPDSDADLIWTMGEASIRVLASANVPLQEPELSRVWQDYIDGQEYIREIARERAAHPGDDIISIMATAEDEDGNPVLSPERVALHVSEIAFAGHDTTAQLMTNMVMFLSENPDQLEEARRNPALWRNVTDEALRRRPSAPFAARTAVRDVKVGGVTVRKGEMAWFALASASNDPSHYEDPQRFDIGRPRPMDHVAFGRGPHTCPGAPLGRAQATIGIRTLYERLPGLRVEPGYPLDFAPLLILPKRNSLPVIWDHHDQDHT
ncbi:cytochrome P450 [Actinomadura sp. SCN-SB]|uniref:cytochrome P450 n=1 Tax=Actinomadura sp. SCN-SB TaxID=3373092 RepID=UPI003750BFF0